MTNMERISTRKGLQLTVQCSKCYGNFLNVIDPLIMPMIFISLPRREKADGNNEFCLENQKSHCESRITTC